METTPVIIEKVLNASPGRIWKALTDREEMKKWYFDISAFKAEPGFAFEFYEPGDAKKFRHSCIIQEAIPPKKLSYTWRYDMDPAVTLVSFELFPEGAATRVRVTHTGLDDFSPDNPDLKKQNFVNGWTEIIGKNLKEFVEQ